MFDTPRFADEEVFAFMQRNPATGAKLAYARAHTTSPGDEFVESRVDCLQDIAGLECGTALYVEWKDFSATVYYKKRDGWIIIMTKI